MIAYVFWHWPSPAVAGAAYEQALLAFHGALANARLPGFQESVVCRVEGAGWLPRQPTAYEDWYLVHDFTALGLVNEGAVAGACRAPHEAVARHAAGGTAGLYGLARGAEAPPTQPCATWLAKPGGDELREVLRGARRRERPRGSEPLAATARPGAYPGVLPAEPGAGRPRPARPRAAAPGHPPPRVAAGALVSLRPLC